MTEPDTDAVRHFFTRIDATQLEVWQFTLKPDVSWLNTVKKKVTLVPFFEAKPGDVVSELSRPRKVTDAWFAQHSARSVGNRTIHAIQPVTAGGTAMALVYTNSFRRNALGMYERYAVTEVEGELKVVSRQVYSTEYGWQHAGGRELTSIKSTGDAEKFEAPTHEDSKTRYDDL